MSVHQAGQRMSAGLVVLVICLSGCLAPTHLDSPAQRTIPKPFVAELFPTASARPRTDASPLPIAHPNTLAASTKPAHHPNADEKARVLQNVAFGRLLETRLAVEQKAHLILPVGLEVFVYSGRETEIAVDSTALMQLLTGRFQFLDRLTDSRYQYSFAEAKRRLDLRDFQGYSVHVVLSELPQSCIVYSDAQTPLYRPLIVTYPDDPAARHCQAVGYTINYAYTAASPQGERPTARHNIAGIILTPTADASGRYRNTEQPSKLRVELPASEVDGFTIGHEFLHACVGYFDNNPILNTYSEERQIQLLDTAYYPVYAHMTEKPIPFQVVYGAAASSQPLSQ
jgi:hypothetical protein